MNTTVELEAKPVQGGEWNGWFQGRFKVEAPGQYHLDLVIPESGETLSKNFVVKESNPELDNTRPDLGHLYQLASEVTDYLPRMDKDTQKEVLYRYRINVSTHSKCRTATIWPATEANKRGIRLFDLLH